MTKKHFEEAARIIKDIANDQERHKTAIRFATLFRQFNPRFDSGRFFRACGV